MPLFAGLDGDGFVAVMFDHVGTLPEDGVGPPSPVPSGPYIYRQVPAGTLEVIEAQRSPTSRLKQVADSLVWVEAEPLDQLKAAAIAKTYPDVDAVYDAAIGRRATEYERAEAAARVYMAADPRPAVVSDYITGHALNNPTGQQQTNEWAAQQIIERADVFRWAELQMRNVRFARQADMRAATSPEELAVAVAGWNNFITWLRSTLGL